MNSIVQNLNYLGFAPRGTWEIQDAQDDPGVTKVWWIRIKPGRLASGLLASIASISKAPMASILRSRGARLVGEWTARADSSSYM